MEDDPKPTQVGKWRERANDTKRLIREPSYAKEYFPRIFVRAWRTRGGGWYGIGYLATFIYLEVSMTVDEFISSSSTSEFISNSVGEFFGRWFGESLANMVQAFLWPFHVVQYFGGIAGAAILAGIYLGFEHFIRPVAEARFPELAEDRLAREEKKRAKQEKKAKKDKKKLRSDEES